LNLTASPRTAKSPPLRMDPPAPARRRHLIRAPSLTHEGRLVDRELAGPGGLERLTVLNTTENGPVAPPITGLIGNKHQLICLRMARTRCGSVPTPASLHVRRQAPQRLFRRRPAPVYVPLPCLRNTPMGLPTSECNPSASQTPPPCARPTMGKLLVPNHHGPRPSLTRPALVPTTPTPSPPRPPSNPCSSKASSRTPTGLPRKKIKPRPPVTIPRAARETSSIFNTPASTSPPPPTQVPPFKNIALEGP